MNIDIKKLKYPPLIIGSALVIAALIFLIAASGFSRQGRFVEVKGLAERIVKADVAVWSMNIEVKSNSTADLSKKIDQSISSVKDFLIREGFEESEISIAPINTYQDTYSEALYRYNAYVQISLYTNRVDLARETSSKTLELLEQGVILSGSFINFEFTDLNSIKPEMLTEAIQNARTSAKQFANNSKSSLGKIARADQGVFQITDKDPGSPEYKKIRVVSSVRYLLK